MRFNKNALRKFTVSAFPDFPAFTAFAHCRKLSSRRHRVAKLVAFTFVLSQLKIGLAKNDTENCSISFYVRPSFIHFYALCIFLTKVFLPLLPGFSFLQQSVAKVLHPIVAPEFLNFALDFRFAL